VAVEGLAAVAALVPVAGLVLAAVAAGGLAQTAAADLVPAPSLAPNHAADPGLVAVAPANQRAGPQHPMESPTAAQTGKTMIRQMACLIDFHSFKTLYFKHVSLVS